MQSEPIQRQPAAASAERPSLVRSILIAVLAAPPLTGFLALLLSAGYEVLRRGAPVENLLVAFAVLHPFGLVFAYVVGAVPALVAALAAFFLGRARDRAGRRVVYGVVGTATGIVGVLAWALLVGRDALAEIGFVVPVIAASALVSLLCGWWIERGSPDAPDARR